MEPEDIDEAEHLWVWELPLQDAVRSLQKWRARDPERNDPSTWNQWREKYRFPRTWVDDEDDDGWDDEDWDESVNGWETSEFDGEVEDDGAEESSVSSS